MVRKIPITLLGSIESRKGGGGGGGGGGEDFNVVNILVSM